MVGEITVEETLISLLKNNGYELLDENDLWFRERKLDEFVNKNLLLSSLKRINKNVDENILCEAIDTIINRLDNPSLFERNLKFHEYLTQGIVIESVDYEINPQIKFIDFDNCENNVFQVCHQIKFNEGRNTRIPDVVLYINGIPLIVMELKSFLENATDATLDKAYEQLGSNSENNGYRHDIPTLFTYNAFLVISDGVTTKVGTLTSRINRFNEWKSIHGEPGYDNNSINKLDILVEGLFGKERILDVIKNYLFFISDKNDKPVKILAQYHQYHGVNKALYAILQNKKPHGNGKAGIIWHTQGSGKSYSMVMLAHKLLVNQMLNVPTIVVLTDRIDLDQQMLKTFYSARRYLRCEPQIAESREDLVKKLSKVKQGQIILTTVAKFDKNNLPKNERNNIIVMTDEAHRGHYGLYEKTHYEKNEETDEYEAIFKYGIEKYIREALPNATFIGFTGTPVSTKEKQTTDIFGEIIHTYDMTQSIADGSTVQLCYEQRMSKAYANEELLNKINDYYNELEISEKADRLSIEKSKREMSKMKVILEDDDVIEKFAKDIIDHYTSRAHFLNGKAMIICQTRIAAEKLYKRIISLKPDLEPKTILVVTESNKDTEEQRKLFKNSEFRKNAGEEFKKDTSKYKIAIVCDMWLTGFDIPDLDVMYFIKRLKAHNLMQAIARVNRVYPGKKYGLIVDYVGLDQFLDDALKQYTNRDIMNNCVDIKNQIYELLQQKIKELNSEFAQVDRLQFNSDDSRAKFQAIERGVEFVLATKTRETNFINSSLSLKQAYTACAGMISDQERIDVLYYLSVRSYILKLKSNNSSVSIAQMNEDVSALLSAAIKADEVQMLSRDQDTSENIIELLGPSNLKKLQENSPPNIFLNIVSKLLEKAIYECRKTNLTKSQEYSERLRKILEKYNNRDGSFIVEASIVDLVKFAGDMVQNEQQTNSLGITGREKAFYDALLQGRTPDELLNDETLKLIACELSQTIKEYTESATDWSKKQSTSSKLRVKIKECLKKYNYPPEYRDSAIEQVVKQAEYMIDSD